MTRDFKIISIVFGIIGALLAAIYYDHVTKPEVDRRDWVTKSKTYRKAFYPTNTVVRNGVFDYSLPMSEDPGTLIQPTTIRFDQRGEKEIKMFDQMNMTLLELGLEKDERTVRQLVLARVKADWSTTPDSFKESPDWAALQAHALKTKIAMLLAKGTNHFIAPDGRKIEVIIPPDTLTIQRVLECPLGPTVPPMADFEVRQGEDAVWKEAESNH